MNKNVQIVLGLFISFVILSMSIFGGLYVAGLIPTASDLFDEDNESEEKISEVSVVNSTLDSSTVAEDSLQSVVTIYSQTENEFQSQGSGFIYQDEYIMTNKHVVDDLDEHHIKYYNQEWTEAELVGYDDFTDLAILRPENIPNNKQSLQLKDEMPTRGTPVIALGSPNGLSGTVTTGIVSGTNRNMQTMTDFTIPDSIQTDAALNEGNSGGPLVSYNTGNVIGVNTATEGENIGFAVSSRLSDIVGQSLIETGNHNHSYVGIQTIELSPIVDFYDEVDVSSGLVVDNIAPESANTDVLYTDNDNEHPDVIVGINGDDIATNEELTSYIMRNTTPGDIISLDVYRNGTVQSVDIELTNRPN